MYRNFYIDKSDAGFAVIGVRKDGTEDLLLETRDEAAADAELADCWRSQRELGNEERSYYARGYGLDGDARNEYLGYAQDEDYSVCRDN